MANNNLLFKLISENSCSDEVYMQLEGQAHDKQYPRAGKYTKANGLYSGMPYWIHSDGSYALWFAKEQWRIGDKSYLGATSVYLRSTNSPLCPESFGSNWKFDNNEQFLDAQGHAKMYKYEGMIYQGNKQFINCKKS